MKVDVLVAEIGSTTTVVNAFHHIHSENPQFIGQGQATTSVEAGDVRIGLQNSIDDLKNNLGVKDLSYDEMFATSSAAGGLKMTVHGLVFDMTARAAKEAALGAGAIVRFVTAGKLRRTDLKKIQEINPNIILLAGGVDYGERETALENAEKILDLNLKIPVIYAGNIENDEEIKLIFEGSQQELMVVENVFPKIDELNVEPTRKVIQKVFENHIVHAPGMSHVYDMVNETITPTPASVMNMCKLIYERIGDVLVIDVGGATTDVHSVTEGNEAISRIQVAPEPVAKRTVEGDLGMYVNSQNVIDIVGKDVLEKEGFNVDTLLANYQFIPRTEEEKRFIVRLTEAATLTAVYRHAGKLRHVYGPSGRATLAQGKDLTRIQYIIGTGGALTQLPDGEKILKKIVQKEKTKDMLLPAGEVTILMDYQYILASLGVLAYKYEAAALKLLEGSLNMTLPVKEALEDEEP
ncbi:GlmL-related ornithine degradation protein [Vagococcus elongatus]|uniref:DNA mismatch repair protein MutL n=1 Tax=Vagococcus elongatus TaxID=180344 RepID=A0A430B5M7_9ENTE|nr:GlmL-related ornithine degradation protein [Vagococcus elongatus]RSU15607.1 DNA mismatch repair protein MutL [Vagococcus elongatus]